MATKKKQPKSNPSKNSSVKSKAKTSASPAKSTAKKTEKESVNKSKSTKSTAPTKAPESKAETAVKTEAKSTSVKVDRKRIFSTLMWVLVVVFSFLFIDLMVQYLNNDYSVAVVNGTRVSRSEFNDKLESVYGDKVVEDMITEELIRQEAKNEDVKVSKEEVDKVIEQTKEELGGDEQFKAALEANNLDEERYRSDVELRLLAQKILVEAPSDEELQAFFEQYQEIYFEAETQLEDVKDQVEQIYYNQKFNEGSEQWIADLKEEASIQNNVTEQPNYGIMKTTLNIIDNFMGNDESSEE
jgi:parvulin-like peptidyl-prolyl isomerase